ncbi:AAA domain-containing protein [Amycolatopsis marina]|uniref:AAA domain-containing protein n=1 Tax=Amycolatopsis marina TaxID=490629 RepID=A0A1I0W7I2_9PSEU|nr:AAA domain-containing protein [Amycolatopsis marina]SFA84652.1 AAA domain-containing protein [Amycolatopsis marina]
MTDWRHQAARAVEQELAHARELGEWSLLGGLTPLPEPGHYSVDLRGRRIESDNLRHLCLAGPKGPRLGLAVPADSTRFTDGVLYLRVEGPVPVECDHVWTAALSPRFLLSRLAEGLRGLAGTSLADRLAAGSPDVVPSRGPTAAQLTDEQQAAYRACLAPGVRLVWAPPGTGTTSVLSAAVEELVALGKRVLLVSPVGSAVDDAVLALRPRLSPGKVVRAGVPAAPGLATTRPCENDAERRSVQDDLADLDGAEDALAVLDAELTGYDHEAFLAAGRRLDQASRLLALSSELIVIEEQHSAAARELEAAQAGLREARENWAEVAEQREHLARLTALASELEGLGAVGAGCARGRWAQRRNRRALAERRARLAERIEECAAAAGPLTPADLTRLDDELTTAEQVLDLAARTETELHTAAEALRRKITLTRAAGVATEQDRRFHADCRRLDLPSRHQQREILRRRAADTSSRERLRNRLGWLTERTLRLRTEAEAAAIAGAQVVATTLGTARSHHVIAHQKFDVVLVDQAAAARLAEVLVAVSRAAESAVLFGDFLQPGPLVRPSTIRALPEVRTWLTADVFTHCGIRSPEEAQQHPGCVVLTRQFRFSGPLRTLANNLHYGVLHCGSSPRRDPGPLAEIVLVDASTLGPIPGGATSWPLGAVLARTLAAEHARSFGVLTAQREQAGAALAALRDGEALGVGVGTARSCHGRGYDTVLFDLTCGGSWTGAARARQFGAAITRARRTLYLLADLATVSSASTASPLGVLNGVRLDQQVPVVGAHSLLDPAAVMPACGLPQRLDEATESIWLSPGPASPGPSEEVLSGLARAVSRGVTVRVMLPEGRGELESLVRDCGAIVLRTPTAGRGVVVLDQQVALLTATRPAPGDGEPERILVEHAGRHLAAKLSTGLRGKAVSPPAKLVPRQARRDTPARTLSRESAITTRPARSRNGASASTPK